MGGPGPVGMVNEASPENCQKLPEGGFEDPWMVSDTSPGNCQKLPGGMFYVILRVPRVAQGLAGLAKTAPEAQPENCQKLPGGVFRHP